MEFAVDGFGFGHFGNAGHGLDGLTEIIVITGKTGGLIEDHLIRWGGHEKAKEVVEICTGAIFSSDRVSCLGLSH